MPALARTFRVNLASECLRFIKTVAQQLVRYCRQASNDRRRMHEKIGRKAAGGSRKRVLAMVVRSSSGKVHFICRTNGGGRGRRSRNESMRARCAINFGRSVPVVVRCERCRATLFPLSLSPPRTPLHSLYSSRSVAVVYYP